MIQEFHPTKQHTVTCPACGADADAYRGALRSGTFDIVRCHACGLRFVPARQLTRVDYDELYRESGAYAHHVKELQSLKAGVLPRFSRARRVALRELERDRPRTLLEIGCGVGNFLAWVQHFGIQGYGIDSSSNAIAIARQHLSFPLEAGLLDENTFPSKTFDVICSWEVLEHVLDVGAFMKTIYDRLNPGGRLMLSTPNGGSRWVLGDIGRDPRATPPVHVTFWDRQSLEQQLLRLGFTRVDVRQCSVALNPAKRAGGAFAVPRVVVESILRPSQRNTLLAIAWKPAR